jgi:putative flippase GtrA
MKHIASAGRKFIITGMLVNAALFGLLELLLRTGLDYRIAVTMIYVLGMVWGYVQNRLWSWESSAPVFQSFARYIFVYALIYVLHMMFVMFLVDGLSIPPLLAAILSAVVLILPVFFMLDRFVFATRTP